MNKATVKVNFHSFTEKDHCCKLSPVFGVMSMIMSYDDAFGLGVVNVLYDIGAEALQFKQTSAQHESGQASGMRVNYLAGLNNDQIVHS